MNKQAARTLALSGSLTIGDLRSVITRARGRGGMSRVNKIVPLEHILDIYEAALSGRPDGETPSAWTRDVYTDRDRPSKDSLIITNILRDCGAPEKVDPS